VKKHQKRHLQRGRNRHETVGKRRKDEEETKKVDPLQTSSDTFPCPD